MKMMDDKEIRNRYPRKVWEEAQPGTRILNTYDGRNPDLFRMGTLRVQMYYVRPSWFVMFDGYPDHVLISHRNLSNGRYQIIPEGEFEASRCHPGMWVWVEGKYTGWIRIEEYKGGKLYFCPPDHEGKKGDVQ